VLLPFVLFEAGLLAGLVPLRVDARRDPALRGVEVAEEDVREREDAVARGLRFAEFRGPLAVAPCFVFLGAITSESYGQASAC